MRLSPALLLLTSFACHGFEPLNTDDAGTVKEGRNQIEQYYFKITNKQSNASDDFATPGEEYFGGGNAQALPFTYTRGLSDSVEGSIGASHFIDPRGSYSPISNKVISIKWRFAQDPEGKWALAIKPTFTLPSSGQQQNNGLGLAKPNYGANLIASKYWDVVELHLNASYMRSPYDINYPVGNSDANNRVNILFFSAAPVWTVAKGIRLAVDLGMTTNPPSNQQYLTNYALLAAILSPVEDFDIGLSYMRSASNLGDAIASNDGASRYEIGFTWRF